MEDFYQPEEPRPPTSWPQVVMGLIAAVVILGLCAGCVLAAWLLKP